MNYLRKSKKKMTMNNDNYTMNNMIESMEGFHFENQVAGAKGKAKKVPVVDLETVYAKVWHALDILQQLELQLIVQDKEIRGIDMCDPLKKLGDVLRHLKPDKKLPSVYAGDDGDVDGDVDSDDEMMLE